MKELFILYLGYFVLYASSTIHTSRLRYFPRDKIRALAFLDEKLSTMITILILVIKLFSARSESTEICSCDL